MRGGGILYLHLGNNAIVKTRKILGVFDLDATTLSKHTRDYLSTAQTAGRVVNISNKLPRAFVVENSHNITNAKLYISQISTITLVKRQSECFGLAEFVSSEKEVERDDSLG